ncbi:MAG: HAD family hydrolase [Candidatus Hodarchaeota archaeon]
MIDFSSITTLLFDIDNTLLSFDEKMFIGIYGKHIHNYFIKEIPSYSEFMRIFLKSTNKMIEKEPYDRNLKKFADDFESEISMNSDEIIARFQHFYQNEFSKLHSIMKPIPIAKDLIKLAEKHFTIVAATNPLFPEVANEIRLSWAGLSSKEVNWAEVTSADDYHYAKPHIEYYQEILERINKTPRECMMIGDDKINDMIAGRIGIKTYLVKNDNKKFSKMITTDLDFENPDLPFDYTGSLEFFYEVLTEYLNKNRLKDRF